MDLEQDQVKLTDQVRRATLRRVRGIVPDELDERTRVLVGLSLEEGTWSNYNGVVRMYETWCSSQGLAPWVDDKPTMAVRASNFVAAEYFAKNFSYSAANTRVSAISTNTALRFGFRMGDHPIPKYTKRGVLKMKPKRPKYITLPKLNLFWAFCDKNSSTLADMHYNMLAGTVTILLALFGLRKKDQRSVEGSTIRFETDVARLWCLPKETQGLCWVVQSIPACLSSPSRCAIRFLRELLRRNATFSRRKDCNALFVVQRSGNSFSRQWHAVCAHKVMTDAGYDLDQWKSHVWKHVGMTACVDAQISDLVVYQQFRMSVAHSTKEGTPSVLKVSKTAAVHYVRPELLHLIRDAVYQQQ